MHACAAAQQGGGDESSYIVDSTIGRSFGESQVPAVSDYFSSSR